MKKIWDLETLKKTANKFPTRREFRECHPGAYTVACRLMVLDDLFINHKNNGYTQTVADGHWQVYENVEAAFEKCETKTDLMRNFRGAYASAKQNGWFEKLSEKYLSPQGTHYNRLVYEIVNHEAKLFYVGITYNFDERVRRYKNEKRDDVIGLIEYPGTVLQKSEFMDNGKAQKEESRKLNEWIDKGYLPLNRTSTGSLGGAPTIWTEKMVNGEKGKYASRADLRRRNNGLYQTLEKKGLLDEFFSEVKSSGFTILPPGSITKESCIELAKGLKNRKLFSEKYPSHATTAYKNGWMDEIFGARLNNGYLQAPYGTWTQETCAEEAKKYETRRDFEFAARGAYDSAMSNGWLDIIFQNHKNNGYTNTHKKFLTKEHCLMLAGEVKSRKEFKEKYPEQYNASSRHGWLDELFRAQPNRGYLKQPPDFYRNITKQECFNLAKKSGSRSKFKKNYWRAWDIARKRGWLEEFFGKTRAPRGITAKK